MLYSSRQPQAGYAPANSWIDALRHSEARNGANAMRRRAYAKRCNRQFYRHGNAYGFVCICDVCGEPYPIWPSHHHKCIRCGNER